MKRITILLVALFILTGFAVAQDMETFTVAITGSATATFGADLDANTFGFKNEASLDLLVTLQPKASLTAAGESAWYGTITIKDAELKIDDGTVTSSISVSEAKITNGVVYVKIYGAPSDSINFAPSLTDVKGSPWFGSFETDADALRTPVAAEGTITGDQGITIGYGEGMITDLSVAVISAGDWLANTDNDFGAKLNFDIKLVPDLLSLAGGVFYSAFDGGTLGFGLSPKVTSGPFTFDVGFDGQIPDGDTLAWDVDTNLSYDLDADGDSTVAIGAYMTDETVVDVKAVFTEGGEAGLVANLGAILDVRLLDLAGTLGYMVGARVDYTSGGLKTYTNVNYIGDTETLGMKVGLELGSDFTGIDKTTFTLEWVSEDVGTVNGIATAAAKVTF